MEQKISRLFTVPYFSVISQMPIVELDGQPPWFLDASEPGKSAKYPWVEAVEGMAGKKIERL